ncbi:HET-domain-containing protein [Pleurostoma richardsiae]|uniref:HET-domain-containing protein n=1 Tax=Pleurostoma richardsiae TaxID=41990 RepID=A0AA38VHD0_9PEZI|nr:HET-domain-containing protein [Pleurostoma richardsiae]
MRLINTTTLQFEEFIGTQIPEYAILSHTWEEEEVSFKDYEGPGDITHKKGYAKIQGTCRMAKQEGIQYAWVDTCCIDKTSSAELSEAINSMFKVCYVYLSDLPSGTYTQVGLKTCRWFDRGWTLQELIAPKEVKFYDVEWTLRDTKQELISALARITTIPREALESRPTAAKLNEFSVAQRMSWAARRTTTRIEDLAYCLMGIFNVNMPLLYGEGSKAFLRLQEEIMRTRLDLDVLAWQMPPETGAVEVRNALASSPRDFSAAYNIKSTRGGKVEMSFTSLWLRIRTRLWMIDSRKADSSNARNVATYVLPLGCQRSGGPESSSELFMCLFKVGRDEFIINKVRPFWTYEITMPTRKTTIHIATGRTLAELRSRVEWELAFVGVRAHSKYGVTVLAAVPEESWHHQLQGFLKPPLLAMYQGGWQAVLVRSVVSFITPSQTIDFVLVISNYGADCGVINSQDHAALCSRVFDTATVLDEYDVASILSKIPRETSLRKAVKIEAGGHVVLVTVHADHDGSYRERIFLRMRLDN